MFRPDPVGWPGLVVVMLGFTAFVIAALAARRRREPESGDTARSRQSVLGIAIQAVAFFVATVGPQRITLDPLGTPALLEAGAVALLYAGCVGLFVGASRALGRNWSLVARTRQDHQLVQSGPFAHLRHPIYTGLFLMMVALAIAFGHTRQLLLAVPLYWLGTGLRVREEERLLRAMFGPAYDAYATRVKRFIPGLV